MVPKPSRTDMAIQPDERLEKTKYPNIINLLDAGSS
jgi:hypothetical protein